MRITKEDFVQYLTIKRRLAANTIKCYRIRFEIIERWLIVNKVTLCKKSVEDFLYELKTKKNLSNSGISNYVHALRQMDGYCKDRELPSGFSEGLESLPKVSPDVHPLTPEEIEKLLNTHLEYKNRNGVDCRDLDRKNLTLTIFLALTGCRFEEAASLKVKHLDLENNRALLVNTKNKHNRFIFIEGELKNLLKNMIITKSSEDLVFTNSKGGHVLDGEFNNDLRKRAQRSGIAKPERLHAHLLRHSFGTELYKMTHDVFAVKEILGHRDIKSTQIYVNLDTEYLRRKVLRHSLLSKNLDKRDRLKDIITSVNSFRIEDDNRFNAPEIKLGEKGLEIKVLFKDNYL